MKRAVVRDRAAGVLYPGKDSFGVGQQPGADMFMDLVNSSELIFEVVSSAL